MNFENICSYTDKCLSCGNFKDKALSFLLGILTVVAFILLFDIQNIRQSPYYI